jgi:hypothetical protein
LYSGSKKSGGILVESGTEVSIANNHLYNLACDGMWVTSSTAALNVVNNNFGYCARTCVKVVGTGASVGKAYCTGNSFYNTSSTKDIDINIPGYLAYVEYTGDRTTTVNSANSLRAKKANFHVYQTGSQALAPAAYTQLVYSTVVHDVTNSWNAGTSTFVVPNTGYYVFTGAMFISPTVFNQSYGIALYVNGVLLQTLAFVGIGTTGANTQFYTGMTSGTSTPIYLFNTDQITLQGYCATAQNTVAGFNVNYFGGHQL